MPPALPIDAIRETFRQAFATGNLVVQAPTGSGKSTRLPLWCGEYGRVLVIEPRRLACRALAAHVAEMDGSALGERIGYAIRFDSRFGERTRTLFVTPGIALGWMAEDGLRGFDTVILDEFHERRGDTDLLAALLRRRRRHRLVVTSATVDGARLARWFDARELTSEGRTFAVDIGYLDHHEGPRLKDLADRVGVQVERQLAAGADGDILVFLPGRGEIEACRPRLEHRLGIAVIPLHAGSDPKLQDRALRQADQARVILATNVAETSLTIPGVTLVLDSGLERRTHHRNGRTVLGLHAISRAAADQRAGRAGRLGPGRCLRLWARSAPLEAHTPPEVLREELTDLVLAAAAAGVNARDLSFPDPLPEHALERAEQRLRSMQAIDAEGRISDHGRRLAALPLDPLFAHLITAMPDTETQGAMTDLAAALSVNRNLLKIPDHEEAQRALKDWAPRACDATTLLKLMQQDPPPELAVDPKTLAEARRIADQTRQMLRLPPRPQSRQASPSNLEATLRALFQTAIQASPELAFVRRAKRREALGNGIGEILPGRESRFPEKAEAALVFDQHSLPGKGTKQTLNFGTCMAPVSLATLADAGLGEVEYGEPQWRNGELRVQQRRLYAGRTIREQELNPQGPAARQALARLILRGSRVKPAGSRIQQDIAAWNLYLRLGENDPDEGDRPAEPQPWLEQRLAELGVESAEDLALIEPEDLQFPGIPDWKRGAFDERFPRRLELEHLPVEVIYEPQAKKIILKRLGGIRKTAPKPMEIPAAWSGWRVFYQAASKVVRVK